jgi:type I restriction enzyme S subunit
MKKLPDGWVIELFEECIEKEIAANKLKIPQNGFQVKGKYPIIDQGVEYIAGFTDDSSKVYKGELPVIIFGDHTRIFKFVDFPFALGADGTKILVPKKILYPKYFYFFLNGLIIENHGYSRHYKFLKEKQIVIPPLPPQKKIAAVLEKAEKLREWRKEADGLTDRFLKSTFLEMFGDPVENPKGWEMRKIGEIGEVGSGLTLNGQRSANRNNLFPYLRVANVFRNKLDLTEIKYIHVSDPEIDKFLLKKNDILIVEGHGNIEEIGRAAVWRGEIPICFHQNHLIRVRLDDKYMDPYFLSYFLNGYGNHGYFSSESRTTSGLNTISTNKVRVAKVSLPHISRQQKFASIVQQVEQIRQHQKESKQKIDDFFNVLMQKAFNGELEA